MTNISQSKEECQQDALRRINQWLSVLEERITVLLSGNDPESMKPGEREQAASRHFTLMLHLLKFRQEYAESDGSVLQAMKDFIRSGEYEEDMFGEDMGEN